MLNISRRNIYEFKPSRERERIDFYAISILFKKIREFFRRIRTLRKNIRTLSKTQLNLDELDYSKIIENILYYIPNSNISRPKIYNAQETINFLLNSEKSLARFGDGEITLIDGKNIPYQKYDPILAQKLTEILKNNQENLIVGINHHYYYPKYNVDNNLIKKNFQLHAIPIFRSRLNDLIDYSKEYCDAGFTGNVVYDNERKMFFENIKKLWENKNVILVHCKEAYEKLKFNIFDNSKEQINIFVPNINSFGAYDEVLNKLLNYNKDYLIILMCGPLGKVLASELSRVNYRALDLGHIAKSYNFAMQGIENTSKATKDFYAPDV